MNRPPPEYLVVADKNSKILLSTLDYYEAVKLQNLIRRGGGEVTLFRSLQGRKPKQEKDEA